MTSQTLRRIEKLEESMGARDGAQKIRITVRFVAPGEGVQVPTETLVFEVPPQ